MDDAGIRRQKALALATQRHAAMNARVSRSLLSIAELNREQFDQIVDSGLQQKAEPGAYRHALEGLTIALLFQKTSTRTRCSFQVGVSELGGHPMYIDWKTSNFVLASLKDEARVLSRYADLIVARMNDHADLVTMRASSEVPVINGLSDESHPCQGLADFMTIKEYFGSFEGLSVAYIGDGNNVAHSLIEAGAVTKTKIKLACPAQYGPRADIVEAARKSTTVELTESPEEAVRDADVIYTDTWVSMGMEATRNERLRAFERYRLDDKLLAHAPSHALVMHCLPAHRGEEITDSVMDSPRTVIFDQAENRKHVQKALMCWMLAARS